MHFLLALHAVEVRSIVVRFIGASFLMVNVDKSLSMQARCTQRLRFRLTCRDVMKRGSPLIALQGRSPKLVQLLLSEKVKISSLFKGVRARRVVVICDFFCWKHLKCKWCLHFITGSISLVAAVDEGGTVKNNWIGGALPPFSPCLSHQTQLPCGRCSSTVAGGACLDSEGSLSPGAREVVGGGVGSPSALTHYIWRRHA